MWEDVFFAKTYLQSGFPVSLLFPVALPSLLDAQSHEKISNLLAFLKKNICMFYLGIFLKDFLPNIDNICMIVCKNECEK